MSKDIKIKFDCNGFNAPAYSCSKPGDNSGFYVQSTDYDTLTKQVAELEFSLDDRDCYIADADMKNEEAAKRVAELEAALSELMYKASECDSWESFPEQYLEDARNALKEGE